MDLRTTISYLNDISEVLNRSKQVDAAVLDFGKAFDKVAHHGLMMKVNHNRIRGHTSK